MCYSKEPCKFPSDFLSCSTIMLLETILQVCTKTKSITNENLLVLMPYKLFYGQKQSIAFFSVLALLEIFNELQLVLILW